MTARALTCSVLLAVGCACRRAPQAEPYTPGLGEIMTLQQMRHTKLWLAGQAGNWDLAAYEIKELGEGFDDIVKYHPTHEESPVAPKDAIPRMMTDPVANLRAAIEKRDAQRFDAGFDALTAHATTATRRPTSASTSCSGPRPIHTRTKPSRQP
jgi:hypothetical protein